MLGLEEEKKILREKDREGTYTKRERYIYNQQNLLITIFLRTSLRGAAGFRTGTNLQNKLIIINIVSDSIEYYPFTFSTQNFLTTIRTTLYQFIIITHTKSINSK